MAATTAQPVLSAAVAEPFAFDGDYGQHYERWIEATLPGRRAAYELIAAALKQFAPASVGAGAAPSLLMVGAGGGTDLTTIARHVAGWTVTANDTSAFMLEQARKAVQAAAADLASVHITFSSTPLPALADALAARAAGNAGDEAVAGPWNAATAILVDHFIPDDGAKLNFYKQLAGVLTPGAPLVLFSYYRPALAAPPSPATAATMAGPPQDDATTLRLLREAFQRAHGMSDADIADMGSRIGRGLQPITEERLVELLAAAGFRRPVRMMQSLSNGVWLTFRN
jgi:tRNA (cmo5U34)-methyltransferase